MDNKIEIFKNEQFGEVRTILEGEKVLFCAADVAKALGYTNPNKAVNDHCRAITKRSTPISGKVQSINFIPEGDVYRLIIRSKLPAAEKFELWVFDEVIPTIRKTGGYMTDSLLERIQKEPAVIVEFAQALILEKNRVKALECELNTAKPKADYGYAWAGVLPAGQEAAEKALEKGCEVYRLYSDNTEGLCVDAKEIADHAAKGGMLGISKESWMAALEKENYLKAAEMSMEDDYGMIDGIINNGPKEDKTAEVKAPERGEQSSIMDRLKSAKAEKQKECCPPKKHKGEIEL